MRLKTRIISVVLAVCVTNVTPLTNLALPVVYTEAEELTGVKETIKTVDPQGLADGEIAIDETNFPDETFREYVKNTFDKDSDDKLSGEEIEKATSIT